MSACLKDEIPMLFNAKEIALGFKKMTVDTIRTSSQEVTSSWYHSEFDAELYIFKDKNENIIKQQLMFCGQIVEWNIIDGVRTGAVFETESVFGGQLKEDLRMDEHPMIYSLDQATSIIECLDCEDILEKDDLLQNYIESPRLSKMKPKDILKKYKSETRDTKSWFYRIMKTLAIVD